MKIEIGRNIQRLRLLKNCTQKQLAKAMGVSIAAVSKWENSVSYPDLEILPELARYLSVSIDELLGFVEDISVKETDEYAEKILLLYSNKQIKEAKELIGSLICKYPDNLYLKFKAASVIMKSLIYMNEQEITEHCKCCAELLECSRYSENNDIQQASLTVLISLKIMVEDMNEALDYCELLDDKRAANRFKAAVYHHQGDITNAKKLLQTLLFEELRNAVLDLYSLSSLEKDECSAEILNKAVHISQITELDSIPGFMISYYLKRMENTIKVNREEALEILDKIKANVTNQGLKDTLCFNMIELSDFNMQTVVDHCIHLLTMNELIDEIKDTNEFKDTILYLENIRKSSTA